MRPSGIFYYSVISYVSYLFKTAFVFTLSCHGPSCLEPILILSSLPTKEEVFGNKQASAVASKGKNQRNKVFFSG